MGTSGGQGERPTCIVLNRRRAAVSCRRVIIAAHRGHWSQYAVADRRFRRVQDRLGATMLFPGYIRDARRSRQASRSVVRWGRENCSWVDDPNCGSRLWNSCCGSCRMGRDRSRERPVAGQVGTAADRQQCVEGERKVPPRVPSRARGSRCLRSDIARVTLRRHTEDVLVAATTKGGGGRRTKVMTCSGQAADLGL
jgi:hypothetical protein